MKYFLKKLLGHEIFRSMILWATNFFFEKFIKPSAPPSPPPTYLTYAPLKRFDTMKTYRHTFTYSWVVHYRKIFENLV